MLAPLVTAMVLSASPDLADDFLLICERAQTAPSREAFTAALHMRLKTEAAANVLEDANSVPDNQKLETFRLGAHAVGLGSWNCQAIDRLFGPQRMLPESPAKRPAARRVHARFTRYVSR